MNAAQSISMPSKTMDLTLTSNGIATERPLSIAIVAMGGQGGGVLTSWIVELAETQGWVAQATSVPGVAQRTGATIYYVEMMRAGNNGQRPVLAQMPTPDDVDVVIAAEFIEAGRSILRGLVTPDRTTLIASSHRMLSTLEKMAPGESIADSDVVKSAIGVVAKRNIVFDMNAIAAANGSVISAAMYGSLAASAVLPFERESYYEIMRQSGKGVAASMQTFDAAYAQTLSSPATRAIEPQTEKSTTTLPMALKDARANTLLQRIHSEVPEEAKLMAYLGLQKVVDFQDVEYGDEYLDLLRDLSVQDAAAGGAQKRHFFTQQAAKYIANAMCYDDVIRVARIKTDAARRTRIERDMTMDQEHVLKTTEFLHPRLEELCGMLPAGFASWLLTRKRLYNWLDRRLSKGRRVNTYGLPGFLMLYVTGGLKKTRRRSLRHQNEVKHRDAWLSEATSTLPKNYDLASEILHFRRLIKGYSDTHVRGRSRFDKLIAITRDIAHRADAAACAHELLNAAIKDASGDGLDKAIREIEGQA